MMLRYVGVLVLVLLPVTSGAYREGEPRNFSDDLSAAALEQTTHPGTYDPAYLSIPYPNGDVPAGQGVCSDVVIRSYRRLGIDLQVDVHEEMAAHFDEFPTKWGLKGPDTNIDHRRVLNLQTFFARKGIVLPVTGDPEDYRPGDLVTWDLAVNLPHIGIVVNKTTTFGKRPMIVNNKGKGPKLEDILFEYPITGHYRYYGKLGNKVK